MRVIVRHWFNGGISLIQSAYTLIESILEVFLSAILFNNRVTNLASVCNTRKRGVWKRYQALVHFFRYQYIKPLKLLSRSFSSRS